jgi:hypothetical protein
MYKIIGADGNEYGPVTAEQLRQWIAEGRANAQTKVQAEGSTEWKALSEFPEFTSAFVGAEAATAPSVAHGALAEHISARGIDIGSSVRRGWQLVMNNFGLLVGASFLVLLIESAINMVGSVPRSAFRAMHGHAGFGIVGIGIVIVFSVVSMVAAVVVTGPLNGGLYWLFLRRLRGEAAEIKDIFVGFRRRFVDLILVTIVNGVLGMACVLPGAVLTGIGVGLVHVHRGAGAGFLTVGVLLLVVGLPISIHLCVSWIFSLPLVIDKQLGFWDAMKLSRRGVSGHWWAAFGLVIVCGLLCFAGVLLCCVGLLVAIPLTIAALLFAYEDIFGGQSLQPSPTAQTI